MIKAAGLLLLALLGSQGAPPQALPPSLLDSMRTIRPQPQFDGWAVPIPAEAPTPRATVYRWFTSGCVWCRRSLPALEQLRKTLGPRGIRVVVVFHPKPRHAVEASMAAAQARAFGFNGPVALDQDWSELERLAGPASGLSATSVTLVLDPHRRLIHADKGPALHPSDRPRDRAADAGYRALQAHLDRLAGPLPPKEVEKTADSPLAGDGG